MHSIFYIAILAAGPLSQAENSAASIPSRLGVGVQTGLGVPIWARWARRMAQQIGNLCAVVDRRLTGGGSSLT